MLGERKNKLDVVFEKGAAGSDKEKALIEEIGRLVSVVTCFSVIQVLTKLLNKYIINTTIRWIEAVVE